MSEANQEGQPAGEHVRSRRRKADEPTAIFEIRLVEGRVRQRLAAQQGRVIYEILERYAAQQQSVSPDETETRPVED
ncbi:hypothetical protein [Nocardia stercoris]|uniref:hypothetical protein n=1 Tax=Nocardia stercoris TaxID=2483361 RepID=UPI0011C38809|nr:hypothetical protein [Nocardia stercoris]